MNKKGAAGKKGKIHSVVDMEAITKIKEKREECEIINECFLTEEELGMEALLHIMPDTW